MNGTGSHIQRVVALYPSRRGYGFAVFEGPQSPIDWGVTEIKVRARRKNAECVKRINALVAFYKPDVVVVEDYAGDGSRRAKRIEALIDQIVAFTSGLRIRTERYSRAMIRECFAEFQAFNKYEIAQVIVSQIPELEHKLPPLRTVWMSEDSRINIFDAVSLIFAFFHFQDRRKK